MSSALAGPFTLAVSSEMVFLDLPSVERIRRISALGFEVEIWDWTRHDIDTLADEAMTVAQAEGLFEGQRRPVFVGHSFGSFIGLRCAERHGARFEGLLTVDMPLLSAVVETNDRIAVIVDHEIDRVAHAGAGDLREQSTAATGRRESA